MIRMSRCTRSTGRLNRDWGIVERSTEPITICDRFNRYLGQRSLKLTDREPQIMTRNCRSNSRYLGATTLYVYTRILVSCPHFGLRRLDAAFASLYETLRRHHGPRLVQIPRRQEKWKSVQSREPLIVFFGVDLPNGATCFRASAASGCRDGPAITQLRSTTRGFCLKANLFALQVGRYHQLTNSIEHNFELLIVFSLQRKR